MPRLIELFAGAAAFSWRSQAAWLGHRLGRRAGLDPTASAETAKAAFRPDLHRRHLGPAGAELPGASEKVEGTLDADPPAASVTGRLWLCRDRVFDGRGFDPMAPD